MSKPFHILKHEHRIIERALRALDGVSARLVAEGPVPIGAVLEILEFITTFADRYHHAKEEKYLFPALERRGIARHGGPLGVMEYEHQVERELLAELRQSVEQYQEGNAQARERFVEAAGAFLRLLVGHIEKEDSILFRIGDEVLEDSDKAELAESFKQVETALGGRTVEDFERMASELENQWAV